MELKKLKIAVLLGFSIPYLFGWFFLLFVSDSTNHIATFIYFPVVLGVFFGIPPAIGMWLVYLLVKFIAKSRATRE